ncbi:MAG: succinylglutamate desuccinylase/aspartoacylase family protein, partial [Deltaproteobacteria bacterium]|nr:succinylglutamate desuccinylase/aspartoacylase family protein [Deltaproteobacteria bacterium]
FKLLPPASPGTRRSLSVIRYGIPDSSPKVYIQAGLHANEAPGFVVLNKLIEKLDESDAENRINGEIVVIPVANPIGLAQWRDGSLEGRFDFVNSINFNRQHQDLAERIAEDIDTQLEENAIVNVSHIRASTAKILKKITPDDEAGCLKHQLISLSHDADIVLDLHCDLDALMHVYVGTPLWPEATDLSAQLGAEVTLLAADSGGTPFDEANSRLWWNLAEKFPQVPIPSACLSATVELRGFTDVAYDMAEEDAANLYKFLQRRGCIHGDPGDLPPLINEATPLTGVDYIKAQKPGIVVYLKKPGDYINNGEVVAEIINPLPENEDERVYTVKSSTEGVLFSRNVDRFARPGRIIAKVAGKRPLREPGGNLLTL